MFSLFTRWLSNPRTILVKVLGDAQIPTLPKAAMDALEGLSDPEVSLSDIAPIISKDPALTMAILRRTNSPYGARRKVSDVRHGVMLLGRREVYSAVTIAAVILSSTASALVTSAPPAVTITNRGTPSRRCRV